MKPPPSSPPPSSLRPNTPSPTPPGSSTSPRLPPTTPTATDTVWGLGAKSNPEADLLAAIVAAGDKAGIEPNRAVFGRTAWQLRYQVLAARPNAGSFAGLTMGPAAIAAAVGLEDIQIAKHRFQSADQQDTKQQLLRDHVIVFHGHNTVDKNDPSTLKRFYTPTDHGRFRVYLEQSAKYTDLTVEHYSNIVTTSTLGSARLNITNQTT